MAEPFQHFTDDYLAYLYEAHPTSATLDGNHVHDDLLDDLSRTAVESHLGALAGFARRLDAIPSTTLTPVEQVEHRMVKANIESRQFDIERVRPWERDPHFYGQTLAASLASQAIFTFASDTDRGRRLLSKLRQVPRLVQAARDNIKDPPAIFVKTGIDTFRGIVTFIDHDLPRALGGLDDMHLLADLADASTEATAALSAYAQHLETDVRPKAKASFRLGADKFERKLTLDEGLPYSPERLLAIAERELAKTQEEFRVVAAKLGNGDPIEEWQKLKASHPAPGTLIATARDQVAALRTFLERSGVRRRAQRRPDPGGGLARLPALVHGQHLDARALRVAADGLHLLPHRRPPVVARGASDRAPARPEPAHAVEHLDARGVSRATSCTTRTCAPSTRRCGAPRCWRPPPTPRAGPTTPSR